MNFIPIWMKTAFSGLKWLVCAKALGVVTPIGRGGKAPLASRASWRPANPP